METGAFVKRQFALPANYRRLMQPFLTEKLILSYYRPAFHFWMAPDISSGFL